MGGKTLATTGPISGGHVSVLLNLKSDGELTTSLAFGRSSEHLVFVYHRTKAADAVLRDGFRDRQYVIPHLGKLKGVLVSEPLPAFGLREAKSHGRQVVALEIPRWLFSEHALPDDGDYPYHRAVIPAALLNRLSLSTFLRVIHLRELHGDRVPVEHAVTVGDGIALDDYWTRFFQREYSTYRRKVRDSLLNELAGRVSSRLHEDAAILSAAGDVELGGPGFDRICNRRVRNI